MADGATVLARYDHPHFGRWPAVTTRQAGRGRITVVGTVPGADLARELMSWLVPARRDGWRDLPAATAATAADGRRVHFVHNWSFTPATVGVPVAVTDALGDARYQAGDWLELGAWDVRVLQAAD